MSPAPGKDGAKGAPYSKILQDLLKGFNMHKDPIKILEAMPDGRDVSGIADIVNVMAELGFMCKTIKAQPRDLDQSLFPCLFDVGKESLRVLKTTDEENRHGTIIVFFKTTDEEKFIRKKTNAQAGLSWSRRMVFRFHRIIAAVALKSFLLNITALATPFLILVIYDLISKAASTSTITALGIGGFIGLLIESAVRYGRARNLAWFSARIDYIVNNTIFSHLIHLPSYAVEHVSVAAQIARLKSFEMARDFFTSSLFLTILDIPFTFIAITALFYVSGVFGFVPLAVIILCLLMIYIAHPRIEFAMFQSASERGTAQSQYIETVEKIDALRQSGMTKIMLNRYKKQSAKSCRSGFYTSFLGQFLESVSYLINMVGAVVLIYGCVEQTLNGVMTSGGVFASLILYWRIVAPWLTLCGNISRFEQVFRSFDQIDKLLLVETEKESSAGQSASKISGALTFFNVGMRYAKNSDPVCVGLSFEVEKGMCVAIAGANGSGKTTLLKLALGLYRPQAGAILIDGHDIRQIDPVHLRQSIAYVPQIPQIFDATIAQIIRYSNPLATDKEIWQALEFADAASFISSLPEGLDAVLSNEDEHVRSMLEYKITLARAYIRNANIVLFDEIPYALLNGEAGRRLNEQILSWKGRKTVLIVSHRDDYILSCDKALGLLHGNRFTFDKPEHVISKLRDDAFLHQRRLA